MKPGTLKIRHSELELRNQFVVYVGDSGGGEAGGGEDSKGAALARHNIFTIAEMTVLTRCSGLGRADDHFCSVGLVCRIVL